MLTHELAAHLRQIGTVKVRQSTVCALCRRAGVDMVIRGSDGVERAYHCACVETKLKDEIKVLPCSMTS